jgi:hypothetical protein
MAGLQQHFKGVVDHFEVDLAQFTLFHGSTTYTTPLYLSTLGPRKSSRPVRGQTRA